MKFLSVKLGSVAFCLAVASVQELQEQDRQGRPGAGVGPRTQKPTATQTKRRAR